MNQNIIQFPQKNTNKIHKVKNIKNLTGFFSNMLNLYRQKQDEIKQRKIKFLTHKAYKFYYDLLETPKVSDVDLPEFIYEEQRRKIAYEKASEAMLEVINNNRINKCYKKCVQEIKAANN